MARPQWTFTLNVGPFGSDGTVWSIARPNGSMIGVWRTNAVGMDLFRLTEDGWERNADVTGRLNLTGNESQRLRTLGRFAAEAVRPELNGNRDVTIKLGPPPFPLTAIDP